MHCRGVDPLLVEDGVGSPRSVQHAAVGKVQGGGRGKPCSSVKLETVKGRKSAKERATAGEEKVVLVDVE